MVVVAQLVRALVCGAGGRGFESHQPPIKRELIINSFFYFNLFKLRKSCGLVLKPGSCPIFLSLPSIITIVGQ